MRATSAPAIFVTPDGEVRLEVTLDAETVWLSQAQLAKLFQRDQSVVARHISSVFKEKELPKETSMQILHRTASGRPATLYSLDVIISVGYRVKSKRGTQFRIWANGVLRDYLLRGYALNQHRLASHGLDDVHRAITLASRALGALPGATDEAPAILDIVGRFSATWKTLLQYDEERLPDQPLHPTQPRARLTVVQARKAIIELSASLAARAEATPLFARERPGMLEGILGNLEQTFGGVSLYPTVEARAAHLLYFIIKDHPFSDGNKRIGCFLFLHYLDKNRTLALPDGSLRFDGNALVALALLIAESDPGDKDLMVRLIIHLLSQPQPQRRDRAPALARQ